MKKFYLFFIMLAVVLGAVSFVACDTNDPKENENQNNSSQKDDLQGKWVYQVSEAGYMYFEFNGTTFKFHEVGSMGGQVIDAWAGGSYVIVGNDLTLSFTDSNVDEMKANLSKMETHAVLDGNTIHYKGYDFVLQK